MCISNPNLQSSQLALMWLFYLMRSACSFASVRVRWLCSGVQVLVNHHFLLCTLVVWNAFSMEALPIFLDRLADPFTAVLVSVTVVLFFGASPLTLLRSHGEWLFAQSERSLQLRAYEGHVTWLDRACAHSRRRLEMHRPRFPRD